MNLNLGISVSRDISLLFKVVNGYFRPHPCNLNVLRNKHSWYVKIIAFWECWNCNLLVLLRDYVHIEIWFGLMKPKTLTPQSSTKRKIPWEAMAFTLYWELSNSAATSSELSSSPNTQIRLHFKCQCFKIFLSFFITI